MLGAAGTAAGWTLLILAVVTVAAGPALLVLAAAGRTLLVLEAAIVLAGRKFLVLAAATENAGTLLVLAALLVLAEG